MSDSLGTIKAFVSMVTSEQAVGKQSKDDYDAALQAAQGMAGAVNAAAKTATQAMAKSDQEINKILEGIRKNIVIASQTLMALQSTLKTFSLQPYSGDTVVNAGSGFGTQTLDLPALENARASVDKIASNSPYGALLGLGATIYSLGMEKTVEIKDNNGNGTGILTSDPNDSRATGTSTPKVPGAQQENTALEAAGIVVTFLVAFLFIPLPSPLDTVQNAIPGLNAPFLSTFANDDTAMYIAQAGIGRTNLRTLQRLLVRSDNPVSGYAEDPDISGAAFNTGSGAQKDMQYDSDPTVGFAVTPAPMVSVGSDGTIQNTFNNSNPPRQHIGNAALDSAYIQDGV